ncbi:ATP-binding protein [Salisediminibacterium halotolerans]|uniref:histidine kinase n=1 Tax=Salisediminibacterium halotolerans TaxID=517425 RepID=A0A1H9WA49_9BACI|nr:ATP-binding protein [Salisediminibacterium haloalkalitolerans]SES30661.1 Signal transduction histidine kinase [Salisediminibacterium haloalkalitolerans]
MNRFPQKLKIILFILLILTVILSIRVSWLNHYLPAESSSAENGHIDLSDAVLDDEYYLLDGEWLFFPGQWVDPAEVPADEGFAVEIPSDWPDEELPSDEPMTGKGSYLLQLDMPESMSGEAGIRFYDVIAAAKVYVDGELIYQRNDLKHSSEDRGMQRGPINVFFDHSAGETVNIVVQASNFNQIAQGGINRDVIISSEEKISSLSFLSNALQFSVGIILFIHAIYAFILYFMQKKSSNSFLLSFGILLLLFTSGVIIDDEILYMPPLTMEEHNRLLTAIFICTLFIMYKLISDIFQTSRRKNKYIFVFFVFLLSLIAFFPYEHIQLLILFLFSVYPVVIGAMIAYTIQSIVRGNQYGYFILAFLLAYSSNAFWGALIKTNVIQIPFFPFDFIFSTAALIGLVLKRHADISSENEKQAALIIENEKNKDTFLANTAHELRNPLHGITVITNTLLKNLNSMSKDSIEKDLVLNHTIALQMKFILNDLQDYTLLQEQRLQINKHSVNINAVVTTIIDVLLHQTNNSEVQIKTDLAHDLAPIYGDEQRLFQIFYNLLHNAVKFTEKGEIRISAYSSGDFAYFTITDSGVGIAQSELNRILAPYEKGTDSTQSGIGLGLNISRDLVLLHDGEFEMVSAEGAGVTIDIKLPTADEEAAEIEMENPLTYDKKENETAATLDSVITDKPPVLVIDDDQANLDILEKALQPEFTVTKISSAKEGLAKLSQHTFYLVISDIMMSEMSGYELTRNIRKRYDLSELPILHLTAKHLAEDIITGLQSGANDYVSKPIDPDELLARVRTLVNMKKASFEKVETEAAWLQAQIKPHFLYNTMNAIASLSQTDSDKMVDLLYEFGAYLKNSFQIPRESGLISLTEELMIIKPYLYIEETRFKNKIEVQYNIHDADMIFLPRLALQTLVENAVNHGALKSREKGVIHISSETDQHEAIITISDNGPGDPETLYEMLEHQQAHGVGLRNSHERIKFINGKGLQIEKNRLGGISIIIVLPHKNLSPRN